LVATIGLYGLMSYQVSERTREFGVRIALGARRASILSLVMSRAALLSGAGACIGLGIALVASRFMQPLLLRHISPESGGVRRRCRRCC